MPNTTRGLPFPDGSFKIGQLPAQLQALAEAIAATIGTHRKGIDSITPSAANTLTTKVITFATPFPVGMTPVVTLTTRAMAAAGTELKLGVSGETNTQFTVSVIRGTVTATSFAWHAQA